MGILSMYMFTNGVIRKPFIPWATAVITPYFTGLYSQYSLLTIITANYFFGLTVFKK